MTNYKEKVYLNRLTEFQRWCKDFPPLIKGDNEAFRKQGDYYLSLERIKSFFSEGEYLTGVTFREYSHKYKDFMAPDIEVEKIFGRSIRNYKKKHGIDI